MENKDLKNEQRKRNLVHLITEAVILSLWEQDQAQLPPSPPAASAPPTAPELQTQNASSVPQPPLPPTQQVGLEQNPQQITLDVLIERFNVIRGGKSFTDPEVYGQMITKFKELQDQEKVTIYKFLNEVSKIITFGGGQQQTPGEQETTPASPDNVTQSSTPSQAVPPTQSPQPPAPVNSGAGLPIQPTPGI